MKGKQGQIYFRKSLERWHSREGMEQGRKIERRDLLIKQTVLSNDDYCNNNNPIYTSQIGMVYLKPTVRYSVTLYFHPTDKFNGEWKSGWNLNSAKDSR